MNLVLHFFRKDLRVNRWPLLFLVIWALGIMLWYSLLPTEKRLDHIGVLSLWRYFIWLMCFLIIGAQTQRDAPFREGAFFRTRPVSLATVLRSKGLYALLIVALSATITSVSLLMLGLKPGVLDFLLIFAEELLVLSALGAVSMAMAIRQESAGKYFTSVAVWGGSLLLGWIVCSWFKDWYYTLNEKPEWNYDVAYLDLSRLLMTHLVALAGAVTGILLFARSGRRETISRTLALTAICSVAAWSIWPVNFVKAFVPAPREAPENEWPDPSKLKFAFEAQRSGRDGKSIFTFSDGEDNNGRYRRVQAYSRLTGLTDSWRAAHHNSYQSLLTLSNGNTFSKTSKAWAGLEPEVILPQLGIPNAIVEADKQPYQFELVKFNLQEAAGAMAGARLQGAVRIHFKRPLLLGRIPLEKGASIWIEGRLITITQVGNSGDEIECGFSVQTHMVKLRGGWQKIWTDRFNYVVINAERREFLSKQGSSERNPQAGHYSLQSHDFSGLIWNERHDKMLIPPDWLAGAEFLIIGEENGGSFSQEYDFPNINLGSDR